jgi:hypothetical protein
MATADEIRITRTLIPDTEEVFGESEDETLFDDSEISDFVLAGGGSVLRAAGLACLAIATSEALISKKIRTQDLQTDGPAVADAMAKKASILFARADKEDANLASDYFQIINFGEGWGTWPELTEPDVSTYW